MILLLHCVLHKSWRAPSECFSVFVAGTTTINSCFYTPKNEPVNNSSFSLLFFGRHLYLFFVWWEDVADDEDALCAWQSNTNSNNCYYAFKKRTYKSGRISARQKREIRPQLCRVRLVKIYGTDIPFVLITSLHDWHKNVKNANNSMLQNNTPK